MARQASLNPDWFGLYLTSSYPGRSQMNPWRRNVDLLGHILKSIAPGRVSEGAIQPKLGSLQSNKPRGFECTIQTHKDYTQSYPVKRITEPKCIRRQNEWIKRWWRDCATCWRNNWARKEDWTPSTICWYTWYYIPPEGETHQELEEIGIIQKTIFYRRRMQATNKAL